MFFAPKLSIIKASIYNTASVFKNDKLEMCLQVPAGMRKKWKKKRMRRLRRKRRKMRQRAR